MTTEQKQLLYNIAKWHDIDFYNRMADHWTDGNYRVDDECVETIKRLEDQYKDLYGDLPEWECINDVWAALDELRKELGI